MDVLVDGTFEYPKSQILSRGAGRPSNRVFSSFRSLWQTPCTRSRMRMLKYVAATAIDKAADIRELWQLPG